MLDHLFVFSSPAQDSEEREGALSGSRAVSWMGGAGGCWGPFRSPLQPESQCTDLVSYKEGIETPVLRAVEFPLAISGICVSKSKKMKMYHTSTFQSDY